MSFRTDLTVTFYPDPVGTGRGDLTLLTNILADPEWEFYLDVDRPPGSPDLKGTAADGHMFGVEWRTAETTQERAHRLVGILEGAIAAYNQSIGPRMHAGREDYIGPMFEAQWDDTYWICCPWSFPPLVSFATIPEVGIVIPLEDHLEEPTDQHHPGHRGAVAEAQRTARDAPIGEWPLMTAWLTAVCASGGEGKLVGADLWTEVHRFLNRDLPSPDPDNPADWE